MSSLDRRTPTPQLALRVAAFGIIAFGVFAILFLRLWFLQILQGDQYLTEAASNGARVVRVAAPRGNIVDRDRKPLVENDASTVVTLQAEAIPEDDRTTIANWGQKQGEYDVAVGNLSDQLVDDKKRNHDNALSATAKRRIARQTPAQAARRLTQTRRRVARYRKAADRQAERTLAGRQPAQLRVSRDASPRLRALLTRMAPLLGSSTRTLYDRVVSSTVKLPYGGVALKSRKVSAGLRNYLLERQAEFPGITVTKEYLRRYPNGSVAAQLFGNVGQISEDQLKEAKYRDLKAGQLIGQNGLEFEYNSFLQGKDGEQTVEVDAQGRPTGKVSDEAPKQGSRLQLSIDTALEKTGQFGMSKVIGPKSGDSIDSKTGYRAGGAYVAMDPRNGEILAMGSYPTVDLNTVYGPLSTKKYRRLVGKRAGVPLLNRAIQGQYATGSTFKPVTALAGLSTGVITPETQGPSGSCITVGTLKQEFCNAGKEDLGSSNLEGALQISSDVYFYEIGQQLFRQQNKPLQTWARLFGYGKDTGIDLPGETPGTVPDAAWRKKQNERELQCRKDEGKASCGLVFDPTGQFLLGDNINLSVGQGDFLATPLQVAVAYAGLYDPRGRPTQDLHFPTPQLGMQIQKQDGELLQAFKPKPRRTVQVGDPTWKQDILKGLNAVTATPDGTAAGVFAGWDQNAFPVYGKTGTAQRCNESSCPDQAWFAAMVPDPERPIVVVATVENGGFGTTTAAPVVCRMLRTWYQQPKSTAPCEAARSSANATE
ncbi:penicillin-binding transpeptidase domain-containing protein [Patulibacter minatonensis]|uniref:penicillin-binding transpeptidase domain-containing protein n=1 Tax=Patulibacter minatonensis TaxID=298163 RepID=UPI00047EFA6E|nr:penicillin-binding transpeptidase domain-containing protein [Patulibacter minatonensis]